MTEMTEMNFEMESIKIQLNTNTQCLYTVVTGRTAGEEKAQIKYLPSFLLLGVCCYYLLFMA